MPNRYIFVLSTGRCGTSYLSVVLNTVPSVTAMHEPPPEFHLHWRKTKEEKLAWLKEEKIPRLSTYSGVYAETSHLINLGFVELLLELGLEFDTIWLTRDLSEVALSHYRGGAIPARTEVGRNYLPEPNHPSNILFYEDYKDWPDYTLCYWLAKEKHARNEKHAAELEALGRKVVRLDKTELVTESGFLNLLKNLGLPEPHRQLYDSVKNIPANETVVQRKSIFPPEGLDVEFHESFLKRDSNNV